MLQVENRIYDNQRHYDMYHNLPYGMWIMDNGDFYLFNRDYKPILFVGGERNRIIVVNARDRRIEWKHEVHFYRDGNPPWKNKNTLKQLNDMLDTLFAKRKKEYDPGIMLKRSEPEIF